MTEIWEFPQVIRTGYVDDDNGMFEVVEATECATYSFWLEKLMVSITEPAEGGSVGVVRFKFGDGTDWFEFPAHETRIIPLDFGDDGYEICAKGSDGFQMICANAETKQAKAWVLFRGQKSLQ